MAGKRSGWSEFRRAQEHQRARLEREERQIDTAANRAQKAMERARQKAERQARTDARQREQLNHDLMAAEAEKLSAEVDAQVQTLDALLTGANLAPFSFGSLRREARIPAFDLSRFGPPTPIPDWDDFAPPGPPRGLAAMLGGRARYEQELEDAQGHYQEAVDTVQRAEANRQEQIRQARGDHQRRADKVRADAARHNQQVELFEAAYHAGDTDAVEDFVAQILDRSSYPAGFPTGRRLAYRPEPREIWIEFDLPTNEIVPGERGFRYVKTRKAIDTLSRADRDRKALYASVVAQTALRHLREIFETTPRSLVDSVALNGHVRTRDPGTGQPAYPCLITVSVTREIYEGLDFDYLKPVGCLKHLKAIVSPHPYDVEAVTPIVDFDLSRYKFIDDFDAAAELDSRPDLLAMDPFTFEHLIRQLFEKIGMTGWAKTTQGSRDDGVDVVVTDANPITGGVCVIQAKLYKRVVPAEAVRALWGTMDDQNATKGILVTSSWFGPASREFVAKRAGRIRLIEGGELKGLLEEHLNKKVRIALPTQIRPQPGSTVHGSPRNSRPHADQLFELILGKHRSCSGHVG
ncbi:restriction endonuclease [Frankia sp. Cppng1_Ct_nod]|uniref:restriction endonuclease n=1 Tax=Frankia sp. Cppng1_Ct_nod TaxID=2897162 RepID=UPI001041A47F|nr:restriction endonuclease [Frankia sp. Cppng1_Ct_nod]